MVWYINRNGKIDQWSKTEQPKKKKKKKKSTNTGALICGSGTTLLRNGETV